MYNFNINDLYLSIANYFEKQQKHGILLTYEEATNIFSKPYNLVTIDLNGNTDGISVVNYPDRFDSFEVDDHPLKSGLSIQNTWVCIEESILDTCINKVDQYAGILTYIQVSNDNFKIKEYRKADRMHEYPYPAETLFELINIQAKKYWWQENHHKKINKILDELNSK